MHVAEQRALHLVVEATRERLPAVLHAERTKFSDLNLERMLEEWGKGRVE